MGATVAAEPRSASGGAPTEVMEVAACGVKIRAARPDEVPKALDSLLYEPHPLKGIPGPGSLLAIVRTDSLRHPFIHIVDRSNGSSRLLCPGSMPKWSPDGQRIAFNRWISLQRPYVIAVVNVSTGEVTEFEETGQQQEFAWSPDGRKLAYSAIAYHAAGARLEIGWIGASAGVVHVVGTDRGGADYYDFAWEPDSNRFIVKRHIEDEHDDSVYAVDLWLCDLERVRCRLTATRRVAEAGIGWIDSRRIRFIEPDRREGNHVVKVIEVGER